MDKNKTSLENESQPSCFGDVSGSGIVWKYFFGGSSNNGRRYDRYYKAEINGKLVEKHASNRGVKYSIGNIDEAKKKYKTEKELSDACFA